MIRFEGVSKKFGSLVVMDKVDLHIPKGQRCVMLGLSGMGKSVFLKLVMGLVRSDSGRIFLDSHNVCQADPERLIQLREHSAFVFQMAALFDSMNVFDNVSFGMRQRGARDFAHIQERVAKVLRMVGLPGLEDKMPSELSGGMRKRVGLARAICYRPELILYDEPTTGLDPVMTDVISKLILKVHADTDATSVVVTHDLRSANKIADRVLLLYQGKMYFDGSPSDFFESSDPLIQQFVKGKAEGPLTQVDANIIFPN
jgi:phospholipid/cholesterol/gamma-HCH transport system ATP-binding protein